MLSAALQIMSQLLNLMARVKVWCEDEQSRPLSLLLKTKGEGCGENTNVPNVDSVFVTSCTIDVAGWNLRMLRLRTKADTIQVLEELRETHGTTWSRCISWTLIDRSHADSDSTYERRFVTLYDSE